MKKNLLGLSVFLLISLVSFGQDSKSTAKKDKELIEVEPDQEIEYDTYNRWSIEANVGQAKGIKPFATGYYSSYPAKFFGGVQANAFGIGARYMLSPKFGLKLSLNYDKFTNQKGSGSLDFETIEYRANFEGVVNAVRLFNVEEPVGRFGLLLHGGIQASRMKSAVLNLTEWNGGLIVGFSPQFRVLKNLSVTADVSMLNNFRQHFNWDGSNSDPSNNLSGQMVSFSLGLSYSFGKDKIHGDWAIIEDKRNKELKELEGRIGDIETLMNDTDKDGVPDYLDVENNSLPGVAVDTKGRMVDKNNNGVPDELEKYVEKSINSNNTTVANNVSDGMVLKLINDGYIAAYFDTNKRYPNTASTDNLGFILNYLKTNPGKSIEMTGYADEIGKTSYNETLSSDRAENVKSIFVKAGIDSSRLTIKANGVDDSVDKKSEYARRLVRKVIFKITN
ncbi:OmpA family protein [Flavobacterium sp.]